MIDMEYQEKAIEGGPPHAIDALVDVLSDHMARGGSLPAAMPIVSREAARWWMARQQPGDQFEAPRRTREGRWITPYHDRLRHTLRSFLLGSPMLQSMVVAAASERIWWRGDDVEMFGLVIAEHDRMREMGVDAYRDRMRQAVSGLVRRVTA